MSGHRFNRSDQDQPSADSSTRRVGQSPDFEWRDLQAEHRLAEERARYADQPDQALAADQRGGGGSGYAETASMTAMGERSSSARGRLLGRPVTSSAETAGVPMMTEESMVNGAPAGAERFTGREQMSRDQMTRDQMTRDQMMTTELPMTEAVPVQAEPITTRSETMPRLSDARIKDERRQLADDDRFLVADEPAVAYAGRAVVDPVEAAHRRFGGLDIGASLAGMLAALGMTVLLGGLFAALGSYGYQLDVTRDAQTLSIGAVATGLAVLFLSFLVGGWVAGRIARYDGGRNGLWSAAWFLVIGLLLSWAGSAWGAEYNVFDKLEVPRWFSDNWTAETFANAAVGSALVAIALMLLAGFLGGMAGARYHRRVDATIVDHADLSGREIVTGRTTSAPTIARSDREARRLEAERLHS